MQQTTRMMVFAWLAVGAAAVGCKRGEQSHPTPAPTPAPQQMMQPPAMPIAWSDSATRFRAQAGATIAVQCPPNGSPGTVWGSDTYSDDSSICTAAAHSGRITRAMGGAVQIQIGPGRPSYAGTVRGGETTRHFGVFPGSFTIVGGPQPGLVAVPVPQINGNGINIGGVQINVGGGAAVASPWDERGTSHRGRNGTSFTHDCPAGGTLATVWGTDVYSDDSSICSAAVHAGRITVASGGPVMVFVQPERAAYTGSERNGVTSLSYATYPGSFSFSQTVAPEASAPAGFEAIRWSDSATRFRSMGRERQQVWCPPGGTAATVWGDGPFTDDSSICTAAVFEGRITLAQGGVVRLRPKPGRPSYHGDTRNGVTTLDYAVFPGSFEITR